MKNEYKSILFKSIVITIFLVFFSSCSSFVGGKCIYGDNINGVATITSSFNGICTVDFRPENLILKEFSVEQKFKELHYQCSEDFLVGHTYQAVFSKNISGACLPSKILLYK